MLFTLAVSWELMHYKEPVPEETKSSPKIWFSKNIT